VRSLFHHLFDFSHVRIFDIFNFAAFCNKRVKTFAVWLRLSRFSSSNNSLKIICVLLDWFFKWLLNLFQSAFAMLYRFDISIEFNWFIWSKFTIISNRIISWSERVDSKSMNQFDINDSMFSLANVKSMTDLATVFEFRINVYSSEIFMSLHLCDFVHSINFVVRIEFWILEFHYEWCALKFSQSRILSRESNFKSDNIRSFV
jgi:hypothetical protein